MNTNVNYYDLLGVKNNATEAEIKKAYITQIKKWHPDLNKDDQAVEITKSLNEAKETLLDETKRRDYDYYLEHRQDETYDNLRRRQATHKSTSQYDTSYNGEESEYANEKTYTKWEYFKLYLKYYQVGGLRKILGFYLVLLESLFCSILHLINYLLAVIIIYSYDLISNTLLYGFIFFVGYLAVSIAFLNKGPSSVFDWVITGMIMTVLFSATFSLPKIPNFLVNKLPIYISNLDIYLFKLSISYKN